MKRRLFLLLPSLALLLPRRAAALGVKVFIKLTGVAVEMPQFLIGVVFRDLSAKADVWDSQEGTGKELFFPDCLEDLKPEEQLELFKHIAEWWSARIRREITNPKVEITLKDAEKVP